MTKFTSLENYEPIPEGGSQYPIEFIEARGFIKLREDEKLVEIGFTEKAEELIKGILRNYHKKSVVFIPIDPAELSAYLGNKLGEIQAPENREEPEDDSVLLDKLANDAPIINLVNSICIEGIRSGASDIHLESTGPRPGVPGGLRVRYRLDGILRTVKTIEGSRFPAISSRIKVMANLNILERRQPQDGRITVKLGNEQVDLRVSIVPVAGGESIVLRILGKKASVSLTELGFHDEQVQALKRLLRMPHGLILITGPTGSGKTTTLNAMLREIVSDSLKIVAIEDPVEFLMDGVNQIQINEQIGLGFDILLRRVLRQDPNVIMIGEIRDSATAEIALRSALTGHLVLSTLHTNDAVSVIPRLINMGIEPYLIASVLRGAAAQRLVRRICPNCKEAYTPGPEEQRFLAAANISADTLYHGQGCSVCGFTGFSGRTIAAELFTSSSGLEDLILGRANGAALTGYLQKQGMKTLLEDGLGKALGGITTLAEVEREIILASGGA
ncbi:general secretion pathway protein E (Type II traffic warden ATPase) [Treponema primitia ZAS-2]|uniref:General secretion pathway protein E (Type II traffic warden ATPase) n=1 Tax=Treponema primitia (strain ATCC BAA-887 / DSM 12427 / ZAS-2) TaxID=545694 RepID=F5YQP5_TREPZ|nr:GspE/PulE family protein [Treponema primitia]AEF85326.1 general secretion pathway protein E (Type II traffic warden ATPase) [Treponema primitia ZAS-2]